MEQFLTIYLQSPWTIRDGKAIAPVTMIKQGVLNGSAGPIYWDAKILIKNAYKWNDVPVVLNHPTNDQGIPISVKDSTDEIIGKVVNPRYDSATKSIKAEIEIPANHPDLALIQNIKEVSVGVFSTETETYGEYDGKEYRACSISMEPDHLALLTDSPGACSVKMGCGIRNNVHTELPLMNSDNLQTNEMREKARLAEIRLKIETVLQSHFAEDVLYQLTEVDSNGTFKFTTGRGADEKLFIGEWTIDKLNEVHIDFNDLIRQYAEEENKKITNLQKLADQSETLLPMEFNVNRQKKYVSIKDMDNETPLMPIGMN